MEIPKLISVINAPSKIKQSLDSTYSLTDWCQPVFFVITVFLLTVFPLSVAVLAVSDKMPSNQSNHSVGRNGTGSVNMTFVGNMMPRKNMTMPGGNMTFGASLQNAKMHLMEAIMDLKTGNTKGTMMELNLTAQGIKMHEQEIKSMMMEVKSLMTQMKGNTTSSSMVSKKATS